MTRVTHVKSARKNIGHCGKCNAGIRAGQPYSWISFRFGGRRVRCAKPECGFKRSDMTQSKLSAVYAAHEHAEDALAKWDRKSHEALESIVHDLGESAREVLSEYEEAAEEHPNLAGQTEDTRSSLEDIADELEGFSADEHDPEVETQEVWADRLIAEAESAIERVSEV